MNDKKTSRSLVISIITVIALVICLSITTFALSYLTVKVENNRFITGTVAINLNDGKPVITADEFLFEPGMTVVKDFFVKNESTCPVYYRVYFGQVMGGLASVLEITISENGNILWEGTAETLSKANVTAADDELAIGERRDLQISFHFPEKTGNSAQNQELSFNLCAEAVQTLNNPLKAFN